VNDKAKEEQAKEIWEHHLKLYTIMTTPEERKELDIWYKNNSWQVEDWWGIENDVHFYARLKEAKKRYEEKREE
jgi:hypothetical protein